VPPDDEARPLADDGGMNKKTLTTLFLSTVVLAVPTGASAAVRYTAPSGSGPIASCPQADPCSFEDALDYGQVHDGDEISLASGHYSVASDLGTDKAVTIHGQPGSARPVITSSASTFLYVNDPNAVVRDLIIDYTGGFTALFIADGTVERVVVSASATACSLREAVVRDTVCFSTQSPALRAGTANPDADSVKLRNVTAVSAGTSPSAWGIYVDAQQGNAVTVDAKTVIASGDDSAAGDVYASGGSGGATAALNFSSSNYDTVLEVGGGSATDPGTGSNQEDPPLFVDVASGDLHEAVGSPTIDGGELDPSSGTLDADGAPRTHGPAADIGAYEFVPAPPPPGPTESGSTPTVAPDTVITRAPATKTRKRTARFEFAAYGPATHFECSLDGDVYSICSSPAAVRVKRGRHLLRVRAVGPGGTDPTPAEARWKVRLGPARG
jgi:hypothetical protein